MKDRVCVLRVEMEEAFLVEKAIQLKYTDAFLKGYKKEALTLLNLSSKIRKIIKRHQGYETHDFSEI